MDSSATVRHFLQKNNISAANIKYVIREDNKTNIYLLDGRVIPCFHPVKAIRELLPDEAFCVINKGVLIARGQIINIDRSTYTMLDGRVFEGRKRGLKEHQSINDSLNRNINLPVTGIDDITHAFSILNSMPAAFCVIQLLFDERGKGIDFIFRYCNQAMEELEQKSLAELTDHSFYDIFPNADRKWLVSYANVALNGGTCTIQDYSPEVNKTLTIRCFQPMEGFCACLLLENDA